MGVPALIGANLVDDAGGQTADLHDSIALQEPAALAGALQHRIFEARGVESPPQDGTGEVREFSGQWSVLSGVIGSADCFKVYYN
jgi:hypothetical protein